MSQPKHHSLIEQILNVASGFFISLGTWYLVVKPTYHITTTFGENLEITLLFTVISVLRGYVWRRAFNKIHMRYLYGQLH